MGKGVGMAVGDGGDLELEGELLEVLVEDGAGDRCKCVGVAY